MKNRLGLTAMLTAMFVAATMGAVAAEDLDENWVVREAAARALWKISWKRGIRIGVPRGLR